jgi:uncharacterized LabA/DUF88 family protein
MRGEPTVKRVKAFVDGQNLFHCAKAAFGYSYPNYDAGKLAEKVCSSQGWVLSQTNFYTGIPSAADSRHWNHFWTTKAAVMGTRGIRVFTRPLRYRNQTVELSGGSSTTTLVGQEKGIDVRIALDIVRQAIEDEYDVALIFSQDQDLSEAVDDVKAISNREGRWIKVACAFPFSPTTTNSRGINHTDWIRIERTLYDSCIDPLDYRPKT